MLNLNQIDFAASLNITRSALSQLESNNKGISYSTFETIVKKYNINPYWFMDEGKEMFQGENKGNTQLTEENRMLKAKIEALMEAFKAIGGK